MMSVTGMSVLQRERDEHAWHQRKVEGHVALVAIAEIFGGVLRPLVGFGEQHAVGIMRVDFSADFLDDGVRLGQILAIRAVALHEVGDRVEAQSIHAHVEPEPHRVENGLEHFGIVEVQVGLMVVEPMPEERFGLLVPRPVRSLAVEEDDARVLELLGVV